MWSVIIFLQHPRSWPRSVAFIFFYLSFDIGTNIATATANSSFTALWNGKPAPHEASAVMFLVYQFWGGELGRVCYGPYVINACSYELALTARQARSMTCSAAGLHCCAWRRLLLFDTNCIRAPPRRPRSVDSMRANNRFCSCTERSATAHCTSHQGGSVQRIGWSLEVADCCGQWRQKVFMIGELEGARP